jgi:hypothetical protein
MFANAPITRDEATSKIQTLQTRWDQLRLVLFFGRNSL